MKNKTLEIRVHEIVCIFDIFKLPKAVKTLVENFVFLASYGFMSIILVLKKLFNNIVNYSNPPNISNAAMQTSVTYDDSGFCGSLTI